MPLTFQQIFEKLQKWIETQGDGRKVNKNSKDSYIYFPVTGETKSWLIFRLAPICDTPESVDISLRIANKAAKQETVTEYCKKNGWKTPQADNWEYPEKSTLPTNVTPDDFIKNFEKKCQEFAPLLNVNKINCAGILAAGLRDFVNQACGNVSERHQEKKNNVPKVQEQNSSKDNKTPPTIEDVRKFNEHLLEGTNPDWTKHKNIFVLPGEETAVQNYNNRCAELNHVITLGYPFEAVVGNPYTADIIVVSHNPYTSADRLTQTVFDELPDWKKDEVSQHRWECYEQQYNFFQNPEKFKNTPFPAYNLDPKFQGVPKKSGRGFEGPYGYWEPRILRENKGIIWQAFKQKGYSPEKDQNKIVNWSAKHVAFVELFGYHSANFDRQDLSKFKHTQAILQFIENAIDGDKLLFFRSQKTLRDWWLPKFSEFNNHKLEEYIKKVGPVFVARVQTPFFTTGNILHAQYSNIKSDDPGYKKCIDKSCKDAVEYIKSKINDEEMKNEF